MKDLNKLQKWAKVIFVITVFFFWAIRSTGSYLCPEMGKL